jgi:hypothetical protein
MFLKLSLLLNFNLIVILKTLFLKEHEIFLKKINYYHKYFEKIAQSTENMTSSNTHPLFPSYCANI